MNEKSTVIVVNGVTKIEILSGGRVAITANELIVNGSAVSPLAGHHRSDEDKIGDAVLAAVATGRYGAFPDQLVKNLLEAFKMLGQGAEASLSVGGAVKQPPPPICCTLPSPEWHRAVCRELRALFSEAASVSDLAGSMRTVGSPEPAQSDSAPVAESGDPSNPLG